MPDQSKEQLLLKEAELYRKHGLYKESKETYLQALRIIKNIEKSIENEKKIKTINDHIIDIDKQLAELSQEAKPPELSADIQKLIRKSFSISKSKEIAIFEAAVALARFGQYEQAVMDFDRLLRAGSKRIVAAKNILACHLSFSTPELALAQFTKWIGAEILPLRDLKTVYAFIKSAFEKRGILEKIIPFEEMLLVSKENNSDQESCFQISSININLEINNKSEHHLFDITSQVDKIISFIIDEKNKNLIKKIRIGMRLQEIQCFSQGAIFTTCGNVFSKSQIDYGPKQGNYIIDIVLDNI